MCTSWGYGDEKEVGDEERSMFLVIHPKLGRQADIMCFGVSKPKMHFVLSKRKVEASIFVHINSKASHTPVGFHLKCSF